MRDRKLDEIIGRRGAEAVPFYSLMSRRIRNILLVSSLYGSYTLEEDGKRCAILRLFSYDVRSTGSDLAASVSARFPEGSC